MLTVYLWRLGDLSLDTSLLWFCLGLCYCLLLTEFCFMRQGTTVLLRLFSSDPPSSATQVARLQHAVTTSTFLDPSGWPFFFFFSPIPGIAHRKLVNGLGYPWGEGYCCKACTCLPLHIGMSGGCTAGGCTLRQLCLSSS